MSADPLRDWRPLQGTTNIHFLSMFRSTGIPLSAMFRSCVHLSLSANSQASAICLQGVCDALGVTRWCGEGDFFTHEQLARVHFTPDMIVWTVLAAWVFDTRDCGPVRNPSSCGITRACVQTSRCPRGHAVVWCRVVLGVTRNPGSHAVVWYLAQVRRYLESVWTAVATVRVNVSELVFWKEVRLGLTLLSRSREGTSRRV